MTKNSSSKLLLQTSHATESTSVFEELLMRLRDNVLFSRAELKRNEKIPEMFPVLCIFLRVVMESVTYS